MSKQSDRLLLWATVVLIFFTAVSVFVATLMLIFQVMEIFVALRP